MLHAINTVIKQLNLAEGLNNVSKTCKIMGVTCDTFYRYCELTAEGGVDVLINRSRCAPNLKNRTEDELSRLLLIMLPHSRLTACSGPATICVNKVFLSQEVTSVQSGCDTTLRTSKNG